MKNVLRFAIFIVMIAVIAALHAAGYHATAHLAEVAPIITMLDPKAPLSGLSREELEAIIASTMKKQSAIDHNRKAALRQGGGLFKGLMSGDQTADRRMKEAFEWFRAWAAGDQQYLGKAQEKYGTELADMYNNGELSSMEFKTLTPANEGTNSAGGYNVPTPIAAEITRNLGQYGICRKHFKMWELSSKTQQFPGLLTKPSVAHYAENAAIAASKPVLDDLTLTRYKIAAIYAPTNEYLEDANIDVLSVIVDIFSEQFGITEDTDGLSNQNTYGVGLLYYGAGALTGAVAANGGLCYTRGNSATSGKTAYPQMGDAASATDSFSDILGMLTLQNSALFQGAKFFIPQEILLAIMSVRDSQYRFIANIDNGWEWQTGLDGAAILRFHGYEVVPVPAGIMNTYDANAHVSTPFAAFCNPQKTWTMMGLRGGFTIDMSISATADTINAFTNDLRLFRMKESIAFGTGRPGTVIYLRTSAS